MPDAHLFVEQRGVQRVRHVFPETSSLLCSTGYALCGLSLGSEKGIFGRVVRERC